MSAKASCMDCGREMDLRTETFYERVMGWRKGAKGAVTRPASLFQFLCRPCYDLSEAQLSMLDDDLAPSDDLHDKLVDEGRS